MPQISNPIVGKVFKVVLTEYERGWGQRHWDTVYFDNEAEARAYAVNYNQTHNNEDYAPDWYVRADYGGLVQ